MDARAFDGERTSKYGRASSTFGVVCDCFRSRIERCDARRDPNRDRGIGQAERSAADAEAISRAFGTPKPTLTHSYKPGLLYLRTFPALMGYSSRILAESWESNNLYYAALADEAGVPVSQLDSYVPEWNRTAIENIFATHLEDWPALLRILDDIGRQCPAARRAERGYEYHWKLGKDLVSKLYRNLLPQQQYAALAAGYWLHAQEPDQPTFRVKVDMVVLSFTVTDTKGKYVNGIQSERFQDLRRRDTGEACHLRGGCETSDAGARKRRNEAVAHRKPRRQRGGGNTDPDVIDLRSEATGTNVFVLFDTSNYMYRGFVYASDAIADFIRGLDRSDSVAVYTYSRNLNRSVPLNRDRSTGDRGLRKAVAGDDSALYNCLLLTLRDAAKVPGRKVVIVFSNGPDNASMVAPDDVRAVAEDEGIPIYVISTSEVTKDPVSSSIFKRISTNTGGKSYFAKTWQKQVEAFESIREDLGNSYTVTYYPQPNPNEGFRRIRIELNSDEMRKFKVRARPGYRPQRGF